MNSMNVLVVFILKDNKNRYYLEIIFRDLFIVKFVLFFLLFNSAVSKPKFT